MSSNLNSIQTLFAEIQSRASEITGGDSAKQPLITLLILSFLDAMEEIKLGADFEEFSDLSVLNVIIRGADEGYTTQELRTFVRSLQRDMS